MKLSFKKTSLFFLQICIGFVVVATMHADVPFNTEHSDFSQEESKASENNEHVNDIYSKFKNIKNYYHANLQNFTKHTPKAVPFVQGAIVGGTFEILRATKAFLFNKPSSRGSRVSHLMLIPSVYYLAGAVISENKQDVLENAIYGMLFLTGHAVCKPRLWQTVFFANTALCLNEVNKKWYSKNILMDIKDEAHKNFKLGVDMFYAVYSAYKQHSSIKKQESEVEQEKIFDKNELQ